MKNEMNMNIKNQASETIKALNQIGTREAKQEASRIGDILGTWNRGRMGDCALKSGIENGQHFITNANAKA